MSTTRTDAVTCVPSDYRRAAALLRHWIGVEPGDDSDLKAVNVVLHEVEDERRLVGLVSAMCHVALEVAGDTPELRVALDRLTLEFAAVESDESSW